MTETFDKPDRIEDYLDTLSNKYKLYLKNFDYYYVLGMWDNSDPHKFFVKLPVKFVDSENSTLFDLLKRFLGIVGVSNISPDSSSSVIMPFFDTSTKTIVLNPHTLNNSEFFGCKDGKNIRNFFGVSKDVHEKMLKEYDVKK